MKRRGFKQAGALLTGAALLGTALLRADNGLSNMPLGSVVKDFVMPQNNAQGDLQAKISGAQASVVSPSRIVIDGLKVELYDGEGKTVTTTITSPQCDFWQLERRLSSRSGVLIERPESRITADDVDWDFKTQTALLHSHVKVVLSQFAVGGITPGASSVPVSVPVSAPAAPPASAPALPAP